MKKNNVLMAVLGFAFLASGMAGAAGKGSQMRMGLGLGINRADMRFVLSDTTAADAYLGLNTMSGDADTTDFSLGGYFLSKIINARPADLHWLAGGSIGSSKMTAPSTTVLGVKVGGGSATATTISLFGGIGSEYFLPGTENLSIEANIGAQLDILTGDASGTGIGLSSMNGLTFRYYF